mmetsp:Transcript_19327/g.39125  ORF Transcript_19327/g.39125 Transcript_19327/m.39125 type:complete len:237 (-) Transcript_19327:2208-2918(-)
MLELRFKHSPCGVKGAFYFLLVGCFLLWGLVFFGDQPIKSKIHYRPTPLLASFDHDFFLQDVSAHDFHEFFEFLRLLEAAQFVARHQGHDLILRLNKGSGGSVSCFDLIEYFLGHFVRNVDLSLRPNFDELLHQNLCSLEHLLFPFRIEVCVVLCELKEVLHFDLCGPFPVFSDLVPVLHAFLGILALQVLGEECVSLRVVDDRADLTFLARDFKFHVCKGFWTLFEEFTETSFRN